MAPMTEEVRSRRRVRFSATKDDEREEERRPLTRNTSPGISESAMDESEFNDLLSFRGTKYLARTYTPNKDNAIFWFLFVCLLGCFALLYFCLFHFPTFHFHVTKGYAHLGHAHAQHVVAERLLHGAGVEEDKEEAMKWFRKAADQGHPHASYNLAVGHLTGVRTDVQPGEIHELIRHAHENGVEEATDVLHNACRNGHCD